jgi:thiol-disulfide isomerase/thioredoxin
MSLAFISMIVKSPTHVSGNFQARTWCVFWLFIAGIAVLPGCGDPKPVASPASDESREPKLLATSAGPNDGKPRNSGPGMGASSISAQAYDGPAVVKEKIVDLVVTAWPDVVAKVKATGKPAVVDIWSLACEPCIKEFPGLIRLHEQYGERLNCVSVNVDFDGRRTAPPETYTADITRFLEFNLAKIDNHICATPSDKVFELLDIPSIPAVLLFDAEGNEVARFVDAGDTRGFTYENNIDKAVEELMALYPAAPDAESPDTESPEAEVSEAESPKADGASDSLPSAASDSEAEAVETPPAADDK